MLEIGVEYAVLVLLLLANSFEDVVAESMAISTDLVTETSDVASDATYKYVSANEAYKSTNKPNVLSDKTVACLKAIMLT